MTETAELTCYVGAIWLWVGLAYLLMIRYT